MTKKTLSFDQLLDEATELAQDQIDNANVVRPEALGLDRRSADTLYADDAGTWIAVALHNDRTLQYYGGFEYVDVGYRMQVGSYVFYSAEDERVAGCLRTLAGDIDEEEDDGHGICPTCSGSGEGMYDGSTCSRCGGKGEV